jgi:hypothetical protein
LTSITLPHGLTRIGNGAFSWCSSLTSITIPSSVTKIESYAFNHCKNLKYATVPSHTILGREVFPDHTKVIRE